MEENKVAQKLTPLIHRHNEKCGNYSVCHCDDITKAILQSPDLRVTLVEPRCGSAWTAGGKTYYCVEHKGHEGSHHD